MSKQKKVEGCPAPENVLQHIREMESILDEATQKMDALEKKIAEYEDFQSEIKKLEAYYTSQQWKDDHAMDEEGRFPKELKRGVHPEKCQGIRAFTCQRDSFGSCEETGDD